MRVLGSLARRSSNFSRAIVGGVGYDPDSDCGAFDSFFGDVGGLSRSVMGFVGEGATYREVLISMPNGGSWALNFTP
jgi:hypothetical protein